ncbi:PatB family C-S lyase [Ferrimonas pelagia]|uniref:cysteine-S-conjugate beta-lyase n=1 Tax=Ferrimonas pelagia TaxID=1177826 RepID=A0ABP9ES02_9GAMM
MEQWFDTAPDRQGSDSVKWDRYRQRDVIPMWVADMDFAVAPVIDQAIRQRVEHGVYGYAAVPDTLKQACVEWLARRWGWSISPSWLVALPAVVPGINFAVRALAEPGALAVPCPIYPPIAQVAANLQLPMQRFSVQPGQGWDLIELERACQQGAKTLLLSVPHNPIGQRFSHQQRQALAQLCQRYRVQVVSDEIHGDLILDGHGHQPLASLSEDMAQRTLTLISAGKSFNLAGLPFAFAVVANAQWRQRLKRQLLGHAPTHNVLAMVATEAAWRQGEPWLEALLQYLKGNLALIEARLAALDRVVLHRPDATTLAWIDCRQLGLDDVKGHFEQYGVGFSDGAEFGQAGFVRLNFACPRARLTHGLDRFRQAVLAV